MVGFSRFIVKDASNLRSKGIKKLWTLIEKRKLPDIAIECGRQKQSEHPCVVVDFAIFFKKNVVFLPQTASFYPDFSNQFSFCLEARKSEILL